MEKEIIIWTFIGIFILTAIITVLGIIENIKFVRIPDKYLSMLSKALLLEIIVVIIGFGAASFNELSLEASYEKEVKSLNETILSKSKEIEEVKKILSAANREIEIKSDQIVGLKREKKEIESILLSEKKKSERKKLKHYTFESAQSDFERTIYFKIGSTHIDKRSKEFLSAAAKKLKAYPNIAINLQPHISKGEAEEIFHHRQSSVRTYMVKQGFPSHRILFITDSRYQNHSNTVYDEHNDLIVKGLSIQLSESDI